MMAPDDTQWHGFFEVAERFYMELLPEAEALMPGSADFILAQGPAQVEEGDQQGGAGQDAAILRGAVREVTRPPNLDPGMREGGGVVALRKSGDEGSCRKRNRASIPTRARVSMPSRHRQDGVCLGILIATDLPVAAFPRFEFSVRQNDG